MTKKILIGTVVVAILVILFTGLIVANSLVEGTDVIIKGHISKNIVTGWSVEYKGHRFEEGSIFSLSLWYYPWETKDVQILVVLGIYESEIWLGSLNTLMDGKNFEVRLNNVNPATYTGRITVYEVDKGFFGVFEEGKSKVATVAFDLEVV